MLEREVFGSSRPETPAGFATLVVPIPRIVHLVPRTFRDARGKPVRMNTDVRETSVNMVCGGAEWEVYLTGRAESAARITCALQRMCVSCMFTTTQIQNMFRLIHVSLNSQRIRTTSSTSGEFSCLCSGWLRGTADRVAPY